MWTAGNTTTANFVVFHRMPVEQWERARVSLIVEAGTGGDDFKCTVAARYANQEQAIASATPVSWGTSEIGDGTEYATAFTTIDDDYQLVEIGVDAINQNVSTRVEMGVVTLIIDLQS